ncbi:g1/s-specific cyclin pcl1 (cyclin hcs26) [Rhizoctonia solani AG-1 IB]|uniref:G1/s-specific cyclin pcl1 (Cyclin hcs26) n=1 Tax=Thanatephorus cucumeris (strain AG1-IB / isolate 7/3/14) TaxID=1108050 RepID=M5BIU0_THACB|nr:g1/s-specific cyclin pcl1 (cyclin hcs26) [Rhizoctonia solani AG-1 IB]
MPFRARYSPVATGLYSPISLPASPTAYESRRLCPSSLVHPSSHAECLLHHLEKPVTKETTGYLVSRVQQILSHTPVADFESDPIVVPSLESFASILIRSTFITLPTIICALLYLDRLELSLSSRPVYNHNPTSPHCILLSVLIVASKHQNDSSLTNAAWCDAVAWSIKRCKLGNSRSAYMLIENVFSLNNIMAMERQCLDHLDFDLVVSEEEVELTLVSMLRFFASPTLPSAVSGSPQFDEDIESWLHSVSPEYVISVTGDMTANKSQWFESPQPSFEYLCTRRGSAPAILEHPGQPAICGAPLSYAAFPSDVSDGVSSYPATPAAAQAGANLDFDIEELYQQVEGALAVENQVYPDEFVFPPQAPTMVQYPEPASDDEYGSPLYARGRSTLSKPLGESEFPPMNLRQMPLSAERTGFAQPAFWMEHSEMPFIPQTFAH